MLGADQLRVVAIARYKFPMLARLCDQAVVEHHDSVRMDDRREAMGDDNGCSPSGEETERLPYRGLVGAIEVGGRLIENQDGCILQECAGDGEALAFAAGEFRSALADDGLITIGKGLDEGVDVRLLGSVTDRFGCGVGPADPEIVLDGPVEEVRVLRDVADVTPQVVDGNVTKVSFAERQPAILRINKPEEKRCDRGLAGAGAADDGNGLAFADLQRNIGEFGRNPPVRSQRVPHRHSVKPATEPFLSFRPASSLPVTARMATTWPQITRG